MTWLGKSTDFNMAEYLVDLDTMIRTESIRRSFNAEGCIEIHGKSGMLDMLLELDYIAHTGRTFCG